MKKSTNKTTTVSIEKEVNLKKYYYFLGFIVFVLFANTIGNGYNMDDELVTMNHKLTSRGLEALVDIFTSPYYSDDMGYAYGYRPIVHLSFALEHQLFGEKAGISHLINVVLFAFSVVLFFKLLLKWVGEQNRWMALVIAVLFAVHPIHTEVVASIKNRDEILAFMFVILAGLSMDKLLLKKSMISLVLLFVYFSLAMLSKKSVFPISILFILAYFLKIDLSIKELLFVIFALIIPGALIGSDFRIQNFVFIITSLTCFIFFAKFFIDFVLKRSLYNPFLDWKLNMLFVLILAFLSFYFNSLWVICFAFPFLILLLKIDFQKAYILLTFLLLYSDFVFKDIEFLYLAVLLNVGKLLFFYVKKTFDFYSLISLLVALFYMLLDNHLFQVVIIVVPSVLFFLLFFTSAWIGITLSTLMLLVTFLFKLDLTFFALSIFSFCICFIVERKFNFSNLSSLFPIVIFFWLILLSSYETTVASKSQSLALKENQSVKSNDQRSIFLKEGRNLEFAENTLVITHTKQETIGTGFYVLGEYLLLMIFPYEQSFYYGFSVVDTVGLNDFWVWIAIVLHIGLIVLAILQFRKRPLITIGIIWYLFSIFLFSNWVELVAGMVGERLAFTASAGFCIFLGGVIFWIKPSFSIQKPTWIEWTVLGVVILFGLKTMQRNNQWKDALTLMSHDIQHLGNSAQANNLLALRLMQTSIENPDLTPEQRLEMQNRAIVHFDRAISLWPDFMNANFDKGRAAQVVGNHTKAIEGFREAMRIDSTFHQAYFNLLTSYDQLGKKKEYLQTAKALFNQNQDPSVYELLARGYFLNQQKDSSSWILQEGIKKYPAVESLKANLLEVQKY